MKKTSLAFLAALLIFTAFTVFSLFNKEKTSSTSTKFIITINNQQYDVTQFRYQHQGGDIFQCGADMSSIFAAQHPQSYLNKMQRYLVK